MDRIICAAIVWQITSVLLLLSIYIHGGDSLVTFEHNDSDTQASIATEMHNTPSLTTNQPPTIDLLHLWHLIHPPTDASVQLKEVRVHRPPSNSTASTSTAFFALSANQVPYYLPTVCSQNQSSTDCLDQNHYRCDQNACKCVNSSMIAIQAPPIGQLCLPLERQLNHTCLLNTQCSNDGSTCEPNQNLNGSSVLQQFVALFALRWRIALLAASAGLPNELDVSRTALNQSDRALNWKPIDRINSIDESGSNSLDDASTESHRLVHAQTRYPLNLLFDRLASDFQATDSDLLPGRCACPTDHFVTVALRHDPNGRVSKQLHSLLAGVGRSILIGMAGSTGTVLTGRCVPIRALGESCQISAQCSRYDPMATCRRSRCTCPTGYESVNRTEVNDPNDLHYNSSSFESSSNSKAAQPSSLWCQPKTRSYASISFNRFSGSKSADSSKSATNLSTASSSSSSLTVEPVLGKNRSRSTFNESTLWRRNCTQSAEMLCIKSGKCICRPFKRHLQQNMVSIVWTMLCLLSIILVLGSLLAKNRQATAGSAVASHHSLQRPPNRSLSSASLSSLSLLGFLLGRSSVVNPAAARTAAHQQLLAGCTPPPDFSDIVDQPPSYEEAVRMLQKSVDLEDGASNEPVAEQPIVV